MRRSIIFAIAALAGLAAFLRVWSTAPAYEQRRAREVEHQRLGTEYGIARTQASHLVMNNLDDPIAAIEADLSARPPELVEEWGGGVVLWSAAARIAWERGDAEHGAEMWRRAIEMLPVVTEREARRWGIVRWLAASRALAEQGGQGRGFEARMLASLAHRRLERMKDAELTEGRVGMLYELGWIWKRMADDRRAHEAWERHYAWLDEHEWTAGAKVVLYNQACFASVAGRRDEALDLIERAVEEWPERNARPTFSLDLFEHDPDLDPLRGEARFASAHRRLVERAASRAEWLASIRSGAAAAREEQDAGGGADSEGPPAGGDAPTPSPRPEPEAVP